MTRQAIAALLVFPLFVGLTLVVGCQSGEELGRVHGHVTSEGKPLTKGIVIFEHLERKGIVMTADLKPDGSYEVSMAQGFGLPLGEYGVAISPPLMDHPIGPILERPGEDKFARQIPAKYREIKTSPLKLTVKSGDNPNDIDLKP